MKHSSACLIMRLKPLINLGDIHRKSSPNFMIIKIIFQNPLQGSVVIFLFFLFSLSIIYELNIYGSTHLSYLMLGMMAPRLKTHLLLPFQWQLLEDWTQQVPYDAIQH